MSYYNEISRRGLIELAQDFDLENNNALKNYLNSTDKEYEGIRKIERVIVKLDGLSERGTVLAESVFDKIDSVFGNFVSGITSL